MENTPKNSNTGKNTHQFTATIDGVSYFITATPFEFNDQIRYRISVNGRRDDIFVWDEEVEMYRPLDDEAVVLPDGLLQGINTKLLSLVG